MILVLLYGPSLNREGPKGENEPNAASDEHIWKWS